MTARSASPLLAAAAFVTVGLLHFTHEAVFLSICAGLQVPKDTRGVCGARS